MRRLEQGQGWVLKKLWWTLNSPGSFLYGLSYSAVSHSGLASLGFFPMAYYLPFLPTYIFVVSAICLPSPAG